MEKENFFKKQINTKLGIFILILCSLIFVLLISSYEVFDFQFFTPKDKDIDKSIDDDSVVFTAPDLSDIKKFSSEEEFKLYLEKTEENNFDLAFESPTITGLQSEQFKLGGDSVLPERVSETTVQVKGIDEPDIVKTDGKQIYFSPSQYFRMWAQDSFLGVERSFMPPYYEELKTKIVKSFPVDDLSLITEIDKRGDLLLYQNILTIFSQNSIYSYDVSDSKSPKKKWEIELEENNLIVTSRLYKDKIYLVLKNRVNSSKPCPIVPLIVNGKTLNIECNEIYHPIIPVSTNVVFLAMVLDPVSGEIERKTSFIGSSQSSVVYMSEKGIYITYSYTTDFVEFMFNFFKNKCSDIIPEIIIEKLGKLQGYDISQQAKIVEFRFVFEEYSNSLDNDERMRIENEMENRMTDYYKEYKRDLEKTGIVKIGIENFEILAHGTLPGYPLNQFALDEYQDNLRIATTVGERGFWGFGISSRNESVNDVYVLDKNLSIIGFVKDLGLGEKIYSAIFIQDKGYLVTFREIDPFYVLDLSNPKNPEVKGELKIPGYSSYLHPITKDKILGIGKENWQVKISLFDVSLPEDPKEIDKYILKENWSDVLETHHAFLLDSKHNIFFLPGNKGGYIFSYVNNKLQLIKAVSDISARRAVYIEDYLYIIGDDKIIVLNEENWEKVKDLKL